MPYRFRELRPLQLRAHDHSIQNVLFHAYSLYIDHAIGHYILNDRNENECESLDLEKETNNVYLVDGKAFLKWNWIKVITVLQTSEHISFVLYCAFWELEFVTLSCICCKWRLSEKWHGWLVQWMRSRLLTQLKLWTASLCWGVSKMTLLLMISALSTLLKIFHTDCFVCRTELDIFQIYSEYIPMSFTALHKENHTCCKGRLWYQPQQRWSESKIFFRGQTIG